MSPASSDLSVATLIRALTCYFTILSPKTFSESFFSKKVPSSANPVDGRRVIEIDKS